MSHSKTLTKTKLARAKSRANTLTRRFKIDIENDSTIAGDKSQERKDRTDLSAVDEAASLDVLCADKTGTANRCRLNAALRPRGS